MSRKSPTYITGYAEWPALLLIVMLSLVTRALANWPTTMRLCLVCAAISLPAFLISYAISR